jgi:hypothetical protein
MVGQREHRDFFDRMNRIHRIIISHPLAPLLRGFARGTLRRRAMAGQAEIPEKIA